MRTELGGGRGGQGTPPLLQGGKEGEGGGCCDLVSTEFFLPSFSFVSALVDPVVCVCDPSSPVGFTEFFFFLTPTPPFSSAFRRTKRRKRRM